jgi:hypothetical protein
MNRVSQEQRPTLHYFGVSTRLAKKGWPAGWLDGWMAGWLSPLSYDLLCLGFFSTFVVRSLLSIYATGLCHANPSACVSHQPCNRSGRMTSFSDRQHKSSVPIRGPRGAVSRKVDCDRLLIEGWRCSTISWRKPDSTSIEKRGVWSCGKESNDWALSCDQRHVLVDLAIFYCFQFVLSCSSFICA